LTEGYKLVHQLITISETIGPDDSVWSVFDRKLETALHAVEVAVSIRLRDEMGHGIELVRWLEGWSLRFKQQQKTLLCFAEDPLQRQCLDFSHPNMELQYISSLNEIPKILLNLTKKKATIDAPPAPPPVIQKTDIPEKKEPEEPFAVPIQQIVAAPAPCMEACGKEADSLKTVQLTMGTTSPASIDEPTGYESMPGGRRQIKQNTVIEISGEYQCDNCGAIRMFCKGDILQKCENRECFSVEASFTLQFDLF
jgi:hypothetical protein